MVELQNIDWESIREKLPFERTPEQKEQRKQLFRQIDYNGNGFLSLAEVDKGLRDNLQVDEIFDIKPVIMRAFMASKDAAKSKSHHGQFYIEQREFRLLLQYLRQYFEYFQGFARVDTGDDRRIDFEEFKNAMPIMKQWVNDIGDPKEAFNEIDQNGGGQILFDEFCDWAIKKNLDLEDDDD